MNPTEKVFSKDKTENKILAFDETSKLVKPTNEDKTFGDDDFWSFYNGGGYCDGPNEGSLTPFGAPEKIASHVNFYAFGGWKQRLVGYYYTNVESQYAFGNDYLLTNTNDITPGDYYLDRWLYYFEIAPSPNPITHDACLDPDEMNFYAQEGVPNTINYLKPSNKDFISCNLIAWSFDPTVDNDSYLYIHSTEIIYGVKHQQLATPGSWTP